jgi:hypothetical protein
MFVTKSGEIHCVEHESFPLEGFGKVERRRASHVVPAHPVKRQAFRLIRLLVGERGRIAEWLRSWYGPWQVRFAETPRKVEFTHQSRRVCIEWEINQLNERLANESGN